MPIPGEKGLAYTWAASSTGAQLVEPAGLCLDWRCFLQGSELDGHLRNGRTGCMGGGGASTSPTLTDKGEGRKTFMSTGPNKSP